jgi:hypothetical protein
MFLTEKKLEKALIQAKESAEKAKPIDEKQLYNKIVELIKKGQE